MTVSIHHGDSREVLKTLADASVDSVVCDPPYALVSVVQRFGNSPRSETTENVENPYGRTGRGFMGQKWDTGETAFAVTFWTEVYRVLKPGGHVVAFSGTRTYHRLACAVEDAGFEIRDMLSWLYGSGFPKSHDVSKGIDRAAGATPIPTGEIKRASIQRNGSGEAWDQGAFASHPEDTKRVEITRAATAEAAQWTGWGTALKPACEPIVFARKPLGTCGVNVVDVVEFGLRNQGVEGEIRWTSEPANGAAKIASRRTSSSTVQPPAGETSAAPVGGSETGNGERPTARSSALTGGSGATPTLDEAGSTAEPLTPSSAPKSSPHTAVTANVAESKNKPSSPSITSTAAEPNTGGASTAKSTPSCDASDSPATDTGCFAGIATGLTGSLAHVHISRNLDGSFVWPKGLPKRLDPQPLTVAGNVLAHGTGALNIDACRIPGEAWQASGELSGGASVRALGDGLNNAGRSQSNDLGRWPANIVHDGSDDVVGAFPTSKDGVAGARTGANGDVMKTGFGPQPDHVHGYGGEGSAARFFYTAKADATDRLGSKHPTVKPTDLMRWLVRLVTPPGGTVLDPFAGSGSTGVACIAEGFDAILIEREAEYVADIRRRIAWAQGEGRLTAQEMAKKPDLGLEGLSLFE